MVSFFPSRCEGYCKVEMCYLIVLKFGTQKGGVRVHIGTNFSENAINICKVICDYSCIKNTNMLSNLQDKPRMAKSWKLVQQYFNYWVSNLLWFEKNRAKDHNNTAKKPTVCNNYASNFRPPKICTFNKTAPLVIKNLCLVLYLALILICSHLCTF